MGTQYDNYGGPAHPSNTISQQSLERAMSHYGSSSRYEASTVKPYSRIHDDHYTDYHGRDYPASLRFQDYRYRRSDYHPRGRYVHGDEVTFGPQGESHVASFRFRPGESEIFPMGRYGGGYSNRYRGGYDDRYGGGYNNRYRGGYNDRYEGGYYDSYRGGYHGDYNRYSGGGYYDRYVGSNYGRHR